MFRIDTISRKVDVAFVDEVLERIGGVLLVADGLEILGDYLYVTNPALGELLKVQIDKCGNEKGTFKPIASLQNVSMETRNLYDDFAMVSKGNAYLSINFQQVNQVTADGKQTTLAGGFTGTLVQDLTSVAMANNEKSVEVGLCRHRRGRCGRSGA
jgi:hypothetical protein